MSKQNYMTRIADQIRHQIDPTYHPDAGRDELYLTYAVLAYAKGSRVTNKDVHDAWAAWASRYYPGDEALIPYDMLPHDVQAEDSQFTTAIKKVAAAYNL